MGAYLSTPVREKESRDFEGDFMSFGASSMQGWRMTQEDAHTCQVDFDKENKTALFAVYDGHGGAEVAQYTSMNYPSYLMRTQPYTQGLIKEALEESFLGFDATLVEEPVIKQLKELAGVENDSDDGDEEAKNEAAALNEDASMPLEKVLERYGGTANSLVGRNVYSLRKRQKFQSPIIKTKTDKPELGDSETDPDGAPASSACSAELDEVKTKLADNLVNGFCETDAASQTTAKENSGSNEAADVTGTEKMESVSSSDGEIVAEENSDSTAAAENGAGNGDSENQKVADEPQAAGSSSSSSEKPNAPESTSSEAEVAGTSSGSSNSAAKVNDKGEDSEEEDDTDDEEQDSEDDDEEKWNSEDGDDSEDDDDAEDFKFDGDDDDDDDEDEEEEDDDEDAVCPMNWNEVPGADSGCTAVVAVVRGRTLYVANAGDSRCVLCRDGIAVEMSADHKPEDTPEQDRILKAGGKVTADGRVNGGLNLSRALGDHAYKTNTSLSAREQMITALPDIRTETLTDKDQFMVLACDGIWNVMSSQDVVTFVQKRFDEGVTKLSTICEEMFDFCLAPDTSGDGTGCDNMTCVIVRFNKLHDDTDDVNIVEASRKRKADSDTEDSSAAKRNHFDLDGNSMEL